MPKFLQILLIFLLTVSISLNIFQYVNKNREDLHQVKAVIDGDTILIENSRKIRLAGIEAPEIGLCGSSEATALLTKLVGEKWVKIVPITTDSFGRDVATVYVGNTNINKEMISSGWASFNYQDIPEREEISQINKDVQKNGIGIYGKTCTQTENPVNPKCNIKGNISNIHNKTYFFPGCSSYSIIKVQLHLGESWFCSEKEALTAGFTKNPNCYGKSYN